MKKLAILILIAAILVGCNINTFDLYVSVLPESAGYTTHDGLTSLNVNEEITITAYPNEGWIFSHWQGVTDDKKNQNPINFTSSIDVAITAVFVEQEPIEQAASLVLYALDEFNTTISAYMKGSLTEIDGSPFSHSRSDLGQGHGIITSGRATSDGRFLFCRTDPMYFNGDLIGFEINQDTGALTEISVTETLNNIHWCISPDDKYIFTCGGSAGDPIDKFDINPTSGELTQGQSYNQDGDMMTLKHPVVTPDSRFLYISNSGGASILGFSIGTDGSLTKLDPFSTVLSDSTDPSSLLIRPDGSFLYVETDSGIVWFTINQVTGALTEVADLPVLDLDPGRSVTDWIFHPDGGFLFNAGYPWDIQIYSVDSVTGAISATDSNITLVYNEQDECGCTFNFQGMSPDGNYLLAVSNTTTSDRIAIFEFNPESGTATALADSPYDMGNTLEKTHFVAVEISPQAP